MRQNEKGYARELDEAELELVEGGHKATTIHLRAEMGVRISSDGKMVETNSDAASVNVSSSRTGFNVVQIQQS